MTSVHASCSETETHQAATTGSDLKPEHHATQYTQVSNSTTRRINGFCVVNKIAVVKYLVLSMYSSLQTLNEV